MGLKSQRRPTPLDELISFYDSVVNAPARPKQPVPTFNRRASPLEEAKTAWDNMQSGRRKARLAAQGLTGTEEIDRGGLRVLSREEVDPLLPDAPGVQDGVYKNPMSGQPNDGFSSMIPNFSSMIPNFSPTPIPAARERRMSTTPLPPLETPFGGEGDSGQAQQGATLPIENTVSKTPPVPGAAKASDPLNDLVNSLLRPEIRKKGGITGLDSNASRSLLDLGLGLMATKNDSFLGALGEAGQRAVAGFDARKAAERSALKETASAVGYLKQVEAQIAANTGEKTKVRDTHIDREGNLWAVTDSGMAQISGDKVKFWNKDDPKAKAAVSAYTAIIKSFTDNNFGDPVPQEIYDTAVAAFNNALGTGINVKYRYDPETGTTVPVTK